MQNEDKAQMNKNKKLAYKVVCSPEMPNEEAQYKYKRAREKIGIELVDALREADAAVLVRYEEEFVPPGADYDMLSKMIFKVRLIQDFISPLPPRPDYGFFIDKKLSRWQRLLQFIRGE